MNKLHHLQMLCAQVRITEKIIIKSILMSLESQSLTTFLKLCWDILETHKHTPKRKIKEKLVALCCNTFYSIHIVAPLVSIHQKTEKRIQKEAGKEYGKKQEVPDTQIYLKISTHLVTVAMVCNVYFHERYASLNYLWDRLKHKKLCNSMKTNAGISTQLLCKR